MIKDLIATILLSAFILQVLSGPMIVADYYTNTDQYAQNCENKSRPELHCNGHCQMVKKLEQEQQKDQQNNDRKGEVKVSPATFPYSVISNLDDRYYSSLNIQNFIPPSEALASNSANGIFHPPRI